MMTDCLDKVSIIKKLNLSQTLTDNTCPNPRDLSRRFNFDLKLNSLLKPYRKGLIPALSIDNILPR